MPEEITKQDIVAQVIEDAYTKSYKMRVVGPGSLEVTIPRAIVERQARKHCLSVEDFIRLFRVEYRFDDFDGAFIMFREANERQK